MRPKENDASSVHFSQVIISGRITLFMYKWHTKHSVKSQGMASVATALEIFLCTLCTSLLLQVYC